MTSETNASNSSGGIKVDAPSQLPPAIADSSRYLNGRTNQSLFEPALPKESAPSTCVVIADSSRYRPLARSDPSNRPSAVSDNDITANTAVPYTATAGGVRRAPKQWHEFDPRTEINFHPIYRSWRPKESTGYFLRCQGCKLVNALCFIPNRHEKCTTCDKADQPCVFWRKNPPNTWQKWLSWQRSRIGNRGIEGYSGSSLSGPSEVRIPTTAYSDVPDRCKSRTVLGTDRTIWRIAAGQGWKTGCISCKASNTQCTYSGKTRYLCDPCLLRGKTDCAIERESPTKKSAGSLSSQRRVGLSHTIR